MSENEMKEFFKSQIKLEYNIVESITNSLKNVRNPVVKQVLRAIAFDSQKHAGIYHAAMSISTVTPALTEKEYRELEEITGKHIVDEKTPCSVCHDPHGISYTQGTTTNNTNLINFDISVVLADPNTGRLEFEDLGTFRGQCYLECHGEKHSPKEYDRQP